MIIIEFDNKIQITLIFKILELRKTKSLNSYDPTPHNAKSTTLVKAVLSTRDIDTLIAPAKHAIPTPEEFMQRKSF
jgi:hypothetical protein